MARSGVDTGRIRATRSGAPGRTGDAKRADHAEDTDDDWGVDMVGRLSLGGLSLLLSNRAAVRIRSPLRLT